MFISETAMRGGDPYSKTPSPINQLPYFPTMPESSYMTYPRLAALQHQLHISTNSATPMEFSKSQSWSNLVIPYHQHSNSSTPRSQAEHLDQSDVRTVTENPNSSSRSTETKKKNPYSIEELLKKPDKKARSISFECVGFQQPYGGLVANEFEKEASCHSGNSDSDLEKDIKVDVD